MIDYFELRDNVITVEMSSGMTHFIPLADFVAFYAQNGNPIQDANQFFNEDEYSRACERKVSWYVRCRFAQLAHNDESL